METLVIIGAIIWLVVTIYCETAGPRRSHTDSRIDDRTTTSTRAASTPPKETKSRYNLPPSR